MTPKTLQALGLLGTLPAALAPHLAAAPPVPADSHAGVWTAHHENVLGTSLELHVRAADRGAAERAEAAALAVFDRDERILSAWNPNSEFSRWSRTRFQPIRVSEELFSVLVAFDTWRARTDGALDASVEAATRLWKTSAAAGRTPTDREIAEVREAIAQPHWTLDAVTHTATRVSDVPLALATFAKSWITARAADAALANGASGITVNVGGDVVVRGAMTQAVAIADPRASADNDRALTHVVVRDRAVATSGSYRRGFTLASGESRSHIIDPRTATPTAHLLASTVIAPDAETAGALATAFSVLDEEQSAALAARTPGVEYMLVRPDGSQRMSEGWKKYAIGGTLQPAAFHPPTKAAAGLFDASFELNVELALPPSTDARYRRPYVAVWIEDADHFPVRTLALWTQKPRWLPELKQWYRDDQLRMMSEGTDVSRTVASATRPAGHYTLKWDGKDNAGKPVKAGAYTVVIEASREHGGYQVEHREISFTGKPAKLTLPAGAELGDVTLDYRKR